jgi:hypothetical protein
MSGDDRLRGAYHEMLDLMEMVGIATGQLREGLEDFDAGNVRGSCIMADDALATLAELEVKVSEVAGAVAGWQNWAQYEMEEGDDD